MARNAVGAVNRALTPCCGDDAPEHAGIGRADRLALEDDRRAAMQQRRVDDVAVADDPADVASRPTSRRPDRRRRRAFIDHLSATSVAAVVAHHALRLARGARGIEDVERVGRGDGHAVGRRRLGQPPRPSRGRGRRSRSAALFVALQDDDRRGLWLAISMACVQDRHVGDDASGLDAAGRGQDQLRLGVVDALGDLAGGKAAEHHGVDRAEARAGQHGDHRLGHRRHVDQHPVALGDAVGLAAAPAKRATASFSSAKVRVRMAPVIGLS